MKASRAVRAPGRSRVVIGAQGAVFWRRVLRRPKVLGSTREDKQMQKERSRKLACSRHSMLWSCGTAFCGAGGGGAGAGSAH